MAAAQHHNQTRLRHTKQRLILLAILLVALYVLVPQLGSLSSSWTALRHARPLYATAGLAVMMVTYPTAAVTYTVLACYHLRFRRTVLVQLSGAFVNRLLPAGIGGMGLNAQYLKRSGHSLSQAVAVVATNNTVGVAASLLLIGAVLAGGGVSLEELHLPSLGMRSYAMALVIGVAAVVVGVRHWRQAIGRTARGIGRTIYTYRLEPERLVIALASSLALAFLHVLILWCAGQAIAVSLPVSAYIVVFSTGTVVGAASPTPGGLVGVEAGLTAGFVAYGVSPGSALAVALLYRLLTYWLPLLPGFFAFLAIRKHLGL